SGRAAGEVGVGRDGGDRRGLWGGRRGAARDGGEREGRDSQGLAHGGGGGLQRLGRGSSYRFLGHHGTSADTRLTCSAYEGRRAALRSSSMGMLTKTNITLMLSAPTPLQ